LFEAIRSQWGRLDFVLHSIAFAPAADLHGRVADSSREGFARAMDISCHSFFRMARLAEPLMPDGGTLLTMSYLGAAEVVPHYGVMGPVKAALEASVRYLATELGPRGIRVNAVSPGPMRTRAASGIPGFDDLVADARAARRCRAKWRSTTWARSARSSSATRRAPSRATSTTSTAASTSSPSTFRETTMTDTFSSSDLDVIRNRTFDEISVGDRASIERTLTAADIQVFAALSGDVNPQHIDAEFAASTPTRA
jgi:NAD(P)-dependent dehydrogenase (short-subunit alcohol dehydrogenase family)